jgi:hypothetical protein
MGKRRSRVLSDDDIKRLRRLGLDDAALARLRHVCVVIRGQGWFQRQPPGKATLQDRLTLIQRLAGELGVALHGTPGAIEPELYGQGIDVHEVREQLAALKKAAADIRKTLSSYKATGKAPLEPIVLIARAVQPCIRPTATRAGDFYRVIEISYRALGASDAQMPSVRTLRNAMKVLGALQEKELAA